MMNEIQTAYHRGDFSIYHLEKGYFRFIYEDGAIMDISHLDQKPENEGIANKLTDLAAKEFTEYFRGERKEFTFSYKMYGTEFQKKVWDALTKIPYGETCSYKDVAIAIGNPKACRAVGMANNRNPIMIAVPCHRVIGQNGKLVGYGGGLHLKEELLLLEKKYNRSY